MSRWRDQHKEFGSLVKEVLSKLKKGEGELRFQRPFIMASDIAGQYFCEKKVETQYLHGEIETAQKILGAEAHEKLLEDTTKIKREDLWKKIYGDEPVLVSEMLLVAKYRDLILAGRPDAVFFLRGVPFFLFEYKFSRNMVPFKDHHVQARTYGMLLRNMGFDTNRLFYVIVMAEQKAKDNSKLKENVIITVIKNGPKESSITTTNARIYVNKFDCTTAEQDLDWAIGFWTMRREAIPTRNPNKCKSCEYSIVCNVGR